MIRLLLADDHPVVRTGLRQMLQNDPNLQVTSEASTLAEVLRLATPTAVDVLLLDLVFPDGNVLDVLPSLRSKYPALPVVIFSNQFESANRALERGASAFIPKDSDLRELRRGITAAMEGKPYVAKGILPVAGTGDEPHHRLSKREQEIMTRMITGRRNKEIAFELNISEKTVATHRARLFKKLELENLRDLLLYAVRHGLADWV